MSKEKVTLAMYVGQGDQLEVDGHLLVRGKQYEITAGMEKRLKVRDDVRVIKAEAGSEADEREFVEASDLPALTAEDAPAEVPSDPDPDDLKE